MNPRPAQPADPRRQPSAASTRGKLIIRRHEPEPKVLTLLWSLYLLVAAAMTIFAANHLWLYDANVNRISSKVMVAMIGLGIGALWPMIRLSQSSPRRVVESVFGDCVALIVPAQAVLWPLTLLGGWSFGVTGALALALVAWTCALGGVIAIGVSFKPGIGRSFWMLVAIGIVAAAPIWAISTGWTVHEQALVDWRFCSPLTMSWGMTSTLSGGAPYLTNEKWDGVLIPGALALAIWSLAGAFMAIRRAVGTDPNPA